MKGKLYLSFIQNTQLKKRGIILFSAWVLLFPLCFAASPSPPRYDYHVIAGQAFQLHSNHWTLLTMCIFSPLTVCDSGHCCGTTLLLSRCERE